VSELGIPKLDDVLEVFFLQILFLRSPLQHRGHIATARP
jgi:hypothetical protein